MSLETIFPRLKAINAEITGIVRACDHEDIPDSLNTADLPCAIPLLDEGTLTYSAESLAGNHHIIWLCVYVVPIGQGNIAQNFAASLPFVNRFRDKYAQALKLNELAGVTQALLTGYRVGLMPPFAVDYIGVALRLEVWEHEAVTVAA